MLKLKKINILETFVTVDSESTILEYIEEKLKNSSEKAFIVTPNPEMIMYSRNHPAFKRIINEADIALPDGVGVSFAAYLTAKGKMHRIAGVDFMEKLCYKLSKSPYFTGFYGAQRGVAEKTAECLQKKYSGLKVSYASDVWDESRTKGKKIDVLFVAMGHPKQEEWIYQNLDKLPVKIAMGVGGSFDFISGNVPRAPKFLQTLGLEWLFRLIIQPWRIKRQLSLVTFVLVSFQEAIRLQMNKKN